MGGQTQKETMINGTDGSCYRAKHHIKKIGYNFASFFRYIITVANRNYSSDIMNYISVFDLLVHNDISSHTSLEPECTEGVQHK